MFGISMKGIFFRHNIPTISVFILVFMTSANQASPQSSAIFAPFVTKLHADVDGATVRLNWHDSKNVRGPVFVFRSQKPFENNMDFSNLSGVEIRNGSQTYSEHVKQNGLWYYLVISSDESKRYEIVVPLNNMILVPVDGYKHSVDAATSQIGLDGSYTGINQTNNNQQQQQQQQYQYQQQQQQQQTMMSGHTVSNEEFSPKWPQYNANADTYQNTAPVNPLPQATPQPESKHVVKSVYGSPSNLNLQRDQFSNLNTAIINGTLPSDTYGTPLKNTNTKTKTNVPSTTQVKQVQNTYQTQDTYQTHETYQTQERVYTTEQNNQGEASTPQTTVHVTVQLDTPQAKATQQTQNTPLVQEQIRSVEQKNQGQVLPQNYQWQKPQNTNQFSTPNNPPVVVAKSTPYEKNIQNEKNISDVNNLIKKPLVIREPRVINSDLKGVVNNDDDYALSQIVRGPFMWRDWTASREAFIRYLSVPRSSAAVARARFYLGQSLYFLGDNKAALQEFLAVQSRWQDEIAKWIQATLSKMTE